MGNDKLLAPSKRIRIVLCAATFALAVAAPGAGLAADWTSGKTAPTADWTSGKAKPTADWTSKVKRNADWTSAKLKPGATWTSKVKPSATWTS